MKLFNIDRLKPLHLLMIGLFYLLLPTNLIAQNEFDLQTLESELEFQLNQHREKNSLPTFSRSDKLDAIAFDQAEYVSEKGRIVHEQDKEQKQTLLDRIIYFEALNSEAGENIAIIAPNSKAQAEESGDKIILANEELLVKAALFSWIDDEESILNLNDPNFFEMGLGVHQNDKKEYVLVAVLASLPYEIPSGLKQKFNFRGVEKYSDEKCKDYEENYSTSPALFSDAFSIENGELFFSYHNKALLEKMLENSSDAISAEIVADWQFDCGSGNRLFPGEITKGYLMPLIRKGAIANLNLAEKQGEVKLKIGEIPEVFLGDDFEVNGMIIKDNSKCASIPFNQFTVSNLRWLDLPLKMKELGNDSSLSWPDSIQLEFYAKRIYALDSEITENSKLLKQLGFEVKEVDFNISISPTIDKAIFDGFEYEILSSLGLDSSKLGSSNFNKRVNWQAYNDFAANTFYELETREMNDEAKIEYLNETRKSDPKLDNFLDSLSYMKVGLYGAVNLDQNLSYDQEKKLFNFALEKGKYELALYFFNRILMSSETSKDDLKAYSSILEQKKDQLSMINNLIVKLASEGDKIYDGNPLSTAFLELHLVDRSNQMVRYNYLVSKMKDWADRRSKVSNERDWESSFAKLRSVISAELFAKVSLNFEMLVADHYYDIGKADQREKAFKNIMSLIPKAKPDNELLYQLAEYLAYQDQASSALEILMPLVKTDSVPSKHLFYFLQLSIYDEELVSESLFMNLMEKASKMYPDDFCEFFGPKAMGKQPLEDYELKKLYCEKCKD